MSLAMDGLVCMYCKRRYQTKHSEKYHYHIRLHRKRYYGRKSLYSQWFITREKASKRGRNKVSQNKASLHSAPDEHECRLRGLKRKKKRKSDSELSEFKVSTYGTQKWYFPKLINSAPFGSDKKSYKRKFKKKMHPARKIFSASSSENDYIDLTFPDIVEVGADRSRGPEWWSRFTADTIHEERTRPTDWQHVRQWRHFWDEQLKLPPKRKQKPSKPESIPEVITIDDDDDDDDINREGLQYVQEQEQRPSVPQNYQAQNTSPQLSYLYPQHETQTLDGISVPVLSIPHPSESLPSFGPVVNPIVYKCRYCGTVANSEDDLTEHEGTHTGNMPYLCMICNARFAVVTNFRDHERAHFADIAKQTGETVELEKESNSGNNLNSASAPFLTAPPPGKRGRPPRKEEAVYKCDHCGIVKGERRVLEEHIRIHTGERPLTCKYCPMTFSHRGSRNKHQRRHEVRAGTFDQSVQCNFCSMTLRDKNDLRNHVRDYHGQAKPFKCRYCGKCFAHKCNVESHERVHTGDKPFTCSMCPAAFTQLSQQLTHVRTHTGEKPFNCRFCEKTFRTSSVRKTTSALILEKNRIIVRSVARRLQDARI
ncbi:uncharacterized protein [Amphiura filiformis]|uniref:uncharacterized protein n=1 Tax=Amphiura filiformis TaxID=82378 RepID=UPI003B21A5B2